MPDQEEPNQEEFDQEESVQEEPDQEEPKKKKKHKALLVIGIILLVLILLVVGCYVGIAAYLNRMSDGAYKKNGYSSVDENVIHENEGQNVEPTPSATLEPLDDEDYNTQNIQNSDNPDLQEQIISGTGLTALQNKIRLWRQTGAPVGEADVLNILLIGADTPDTTKNSRADTMMIASVNQKTHTITLASLMRDQYSYVERKGQGLFTKLHHSNAYGGPQMLIQELENYYKVSIDNYLMVNFSTLPAAIDQVGGITVELSEVEANYMRGDNCPDAHAGLNDFDGREALVYVRMRKGNTGGDTARVGRQQKAIMSVIEKVKDLSLSEILSLVNTTMPYLRTGFTGTQLIGLATKASTNGWFKYTIQQLTLPDNECARGGMIGSGWYWTTDFPLAAQKLQMALYGRTNIVLEENRTRWF